MRILYFDCFSGISGDMTIGALLDLGIDTGLFKSELAKLNLDGYELQIADKMKNGIKGTDVTVVLTEIPHSHDHSDDHSHCHPGDHSGGHSHEHSGDHSDGHSHDHPGDHSDGHSHDHPGDHSDDHSHDHFHPHPHSHPMRKLKDIYSIIEHSSLSGRVKTFSKAVFLEIAAAEAKVHNMDISEVHFHEVGAVDSIVDIVGTAICLEILGADRVYSSALHDGNGMIECRHGIIPVPVPAVMEMLAGSGIPLVSENVGTELVTPTGMALIKHMAAGFGKMPSIAVEKVGYGMGKRETGGFNALRVVMGTLHEEKAFDEEIIALETNIDDMSPEILGYVSAKLLEAGALDVFYTPIYMKKSRPAFMLSVLSKTGQEGSLADIMLEQTSTLGVRRSVCKRYCMDREIVAVDTEFGKARVKLASKGSFRKAAPEYEDCRKIADSAGIPLTRVYEAVMESAGRYLQGGA